MHLSVGERVHVCYAFAQEHEAVEANWSAAVFELLHLPNPMQQEVPRTPGEYLTQPFKRAHINRYALAAYGYWSGQAARPRRVYASGPVLYTTIQLNSLCDHWRVQLSRAREPGHVLLPDPTPPRHVRDPPEHRVRQQETRAGGHREVHPRRGVRGRVPASRGASSLFAERPTG